MTITQIVSRYKQLNPKGYFFNSKTLKFFGQTLKDFKVSETEDPNIFQLDYIIWFNEQTPIAKMKKFNWATGEIH